MGLLDKLFGRKPSAPRPERPSLTVTVLAADPSITLRKVLELTLTDVGATLLGASSVAETMETLERQRVDVVIVSVILPDGDGYELCRRIKSFYRLPVILMPGTFEPFDDARAMAAGADAIVRKPFAPPALIAAVHQVTSAT